MKPVPRSGLRSVLIPLNLIIVTTMLISLLLGTPPVTPIATALVMAAALSAVEILSKLGVWRLILAPLAASVRWMPAIAFTKAGILRTLILAAGLGLLASGIVWTNQGEAKPLADAPCLSRPADAPEMAGDSSIWLVNAEGGSQQELIAGSRPKWSPDGRSLAFLDSTYDDRDFRTAICIVGADGREPRAVGQIFRSRASRGGPFPVCNGGTQYSWSRDGAMLMYTLGGIYTVSLKQAGEPAEELPGGCGPALSPDGKRVAFSSIVEPVGREAHYGIWVVYTDGRDRRELLFPNGTAPAFSPDGGQIAFVDSDRIMVGPSTRGQANVVVDAAPTEAQEYEFQPSLSHLTWSPDGTTLAYVYDWSRLFAVELREGATPLDFGEGSHPSWSPDGDQLVFSRVEEDGSCTIYTADADSGDVRKLTSGCDPDWSPDGTRIAFTR